MQAQAITGLDVLLGVAVVSAYARPSTRPNLIRLDPSTEPAELLQNTKSGTDE